MDIFVIFILISGGFLGLAALYYIMVFFLTPKEVLSLRLRLKTILFLPLVSGAIVAVILSKLITAPGLITGVSVAGIAVIFLLLVGINHRQLRAYPRIWKRMIVPTVGFLLLSMLFLLAAWLIFPGFA